MHPTCWIQHLFNIGKNWWRNHISLPLFSSHESWGGTTALPTKHATMIQFYSNHLNHWLYRRFAPRRWFGTPSSIGNQAGTVVQDIIATWLVAVGPQTYGNKWVSFTLFDHYCAQSNVFWSLISKSSWTCFFWGCMLIEWKLLNPVFPTSNFLSFPNMVSFPNYSEPPGLVDSSRVRHMVKSPSIQSTRAFPWQNMVRLRNRGCGFWPRKAFQLYNFTKAYGPASLTRKPKHIHHESGFLRSNRAKFLSGVTMIFGKQGDARVRAGGVNLKLHFSFYYQKSCT